MAAVPMYGADVHVQFARVTLAEGRVEVENGATGERFPAERNLAVGQGFWVETANESRAELETSDGSLVRLGPGSLAELSDLTRLSTGQRITLVSLERGTLYATAEPAGLDAFLVVAPGLEATFLTGARVRIEAGDEPSAVAIFEGRVRFSSRAAELELHQGQSVRLNPRVLDQFELFREVAVGQLDRWNEQRDREAAERASGTRLANFPVGLGELDAAGKWIDTAKFGKVWQPRVPEGWAPFHAGRWRWYEGIGYIFIAAEPWGWLPYHYGRWTYQDPSGWLWAPGGVENALEASFSPGEVYWLQAATFLGWGPLAPGEAWRADARPALYSLPNTTFAAYAGGARVIDPAQAPRLPQDPLKVAQFAVAPPAPPAWAALPARKRITRVGTTRIRPVSDQTYDAARNAAEQVAPQPTSGVQITGAGPPLQPPPVAAPEPTYFNYPAAAPAAAPQPPPTQYYPVYVPEVVVVEQENPRGGGQGHHPAPARTPPPAPAPPAASAPPAPPSSLQHHPEPRATAPPPPKSDAPADKEGPEHGTRARSPESGDAPARRR